MPVEIPLTQGYAALVDDADAALVSGSRWNVDIRKGGRIYALRWNGRRHTPQTIRMHSLILSAPSGTHIDHVDGNGLNNQRSNLRIVTVQQNTMNRRIDNAKLRNKYGFRGIAYTGGRYRGRVTLDGVQHYTKPFATPIEAAIAWDELALKHCGEFATLNFPDLRPAA